MPYFAINISNSKKERFPKTKVLQDLRSMNNPTLGQLNITKAVRTEITPAKKTGIKLKNGEMTNAINNK
ncbi:hypothetical protein B6U96_13095 [Archaeoglobales archaeon ex4484_92]|nr:MAG: hypothetical protein B6U96_13095 [Archaeoglobales archaeon ex4484_92]